MPFKDPEIRRVKNRQYYKKWYSNNQHTAVKAAVDSKKRIRREKRQYLLENVGRVCNECGFDADPTAIDFHHITGRVDTEETLTELSWTRLKELVAGDKLVALCANCHRILHSNKRKEARK